MVHRPADSRLLANLLQQEKEYSKQLSHLLESSNASLASFTAYAAASPPPGSHVIMSVAGALAAVDQALKRYSQGVDQWRDTMRSLKEAEEEVGNIMRDREILVTRLIKASNSKKSGAGNIRESLLSSSSLSLSIGDSPSPSRPISGSFPSSTKLAAAQSELQACETHLAAKERELAIKRCTALRDGLGARIRTLVECGWAWSEVGKEALRTLEELEIEPPEQRHSKSLSSNKPIHFSEPGSTRPSSDFSSIGPSQSASQVTSNEEHAPPPVNILSVINANMLGEPLAPPTPPPPPPATDPNTTLARPPSGTSTATAGSSISHNPATTATYKFETVTYAPAVALHVGGLSALGATISKELEKNEIIIPPSSSSGGSPYAPITHELFKDEDLHTTVHIPAPHAIGDYAYEIPTAGPAGFGYSSSGSRPLSKASSNFDHGQRHLLDRRIAEEEEEVKRGSERVDVGGHEEDDEVSSFEEVKVEKKLMQEGKIEMVENPRFMTEARRRELEREREKARQQEEEEEEESKRATTPTKEREKKKFAFFPHHHHHRSEPQLEQAVGGSTRPASAFPPTESQEHIPASPSEATGSPAKATSPTASPSKGFLGSLKGLFGVRQPLSQQQQTPPARANTATAATSNHAAELSSDDDSDSDLGAGSSPSKPKGGRGLHALFSSSPGGAAKRSPAKQHKTRAGQWETRTDKNIREIASAAGGRRGGSFDGVGVGVGGVGLGVAGGAVVNAGVVGVAPAAAGAAEKSGSGVGSGVGAEKRAVVRGRAASDVGAPRTAPGPPGGRRLKKPRARGPPVSASAAAAAADLRRLGGGVGDNGSVVSVASSSVVGTTAPAPVAAAVRRLDGGGSENGSTVPVPSSSVVGTSAAVIAAPIVQVAPAPAATTQPRMPAGAPITSAAKGATKNRSRRSASVDVGSQNRKSWIEEDNTSGGEMIVDLGRRRRAASDVGGPVGAKEEETVPPMPTTRHVVEPTTMKPKTAGVKTASSRGYSSDTAATKPAVVRKNSLTKKKRNPQTQNPAPADPVAQQQPISSPITTSTPKKRTPIKSTSASTPSKSPGVPSTAGTPAIHGATVLQAGGEHPSGTLVSYPGWDAQAQAPGGTLSRNTSVVSVTSAPAGGGGGMKGRKQTPLGHGMSGVGRRPGGGSLVGVSGAQGASPAAAGSLAHPTAPAPSLMSIVQDVSRSNRGWSQDLKSRKSAGGSKTATANLLDGVLVRAPPPLSRDALEILDVAEVLRKRGADGSPAVSSVGSAAKPTTTTKATGMFEIKAPGSVFDQRQAMIASVGTVSKTTSAARPSATPVQPRKQKSASVERRGTVRDSAAPATPPSSSVAKGKMPLRSAMRSPSPIVAGIQHRDGRPGHDALPPSNGSMASGADGALPHHQQQQRRPKRDKKGKAPARPEHLEDSGGDGDGDGDSVSTVFYSDQGEFERGTSSAGSATKPAVLIGSSVPSVNGHDGMYQKPKSGSEVSHSTASTVVIGPSGENQQQPGTQLSQQQQQSHVAESSQAQRRRKSVRVSLQPTFSPPPPAIEDDYEEEQQRYAPWGRRNYHAEEEVYSQSQHPSSIRLVAPKSVHADPALVGDDQLDEDGNKLTDMWEDSGEDEDEQYMKAKRLLTRAAKRDKDVNLMIAKRRP